MIVTSVRHGYEDLYPGRHPRIVKVPYRYLTRGDEIAIASNVYNLVAKKVRRMPNRAGAVRAAAARLRRMNARYEEIKSLPFSYVDKEFGIHGCHRNRRRA